MGSIRNKAAPKEIDQDATIDHDIEQFFEIIRRFREARARATACRIRALDVDVEDGDRGRAGTKRRKMSGGWVPKFQREDFDADAGDRGLSKSSDFLGTGGGGDAEDDKKKIAGTGNGGGRGGSDKKSLDDPLDLKLTL